LLTSTPVGRRYPAGVSHREGASSGSQAWVMRTIATSVEVPSAKEHILVRISLIHGRKPDLRRARLWSPPSLIFATAQSMPLTTVGSAARRRNLGPSGVSGRASMQPVPCGLFLELDVAQRRLPDCVGISGAVSGEQLPPGLRRGERGQRALRSHTLGASSYVAFQRPPQSLEDPQFPGGGAWADQFEVESVVTCVMVVF